MLTLPVHIKAISNCPPLEFLGFSSQLVKSGDLVRDFGGALVTPSAQLTLGDWVQAYMCFLSFVLDAPLCVFV